MTRFFGIVSVLIFVACAGGKKKEERGSAGSEVAEYPLETPMPEVAEIDFSSSTEFAVTIEEQVDWSKNVVYAPTLGMAWQEIDDELDNQASGFTNSRVEGLDYAASYLNVLDSDEYETSVEISGDEIVAKAMFKKLLMFEEPFDEAFNYQWAETGEELKAFSFWGYDYRVKLNYYNSDEDFSFSLLPKESDHEIVLMLTPNSAESSSLASVFDYFSLQTSDQTKNSRPEWKNWINDDDFGRIPYIAFNLECEFADIVGSSFMVPNTQFVFTKFYQRNAFVLDRTGAVVESEAEIVTEAAEEPGEEVPTKRMVLDKPFFVFLKKESKELPYFAVFVKNTDLLVKR